MHYFHSREESAEILRRALQLMAPHKAAFHPLSYALWYEHAADLNPNLSRDLEKYSVPTAPLCEPDVSRLYALHIAARDVEAFERQSTRHRKSNDARSNNHCIGFKHLIVGSCAWS